VILTPALITEVAGVTVNVKGEPGVKVTDVNPERPLLVAVIAAVPITIEVTVEVAMPLLVVPEGVMLPKLEVNVTVVPLLTALPY
jgi:hypothetical protein